MTKKSKELADAPLLVELFRGFDKLKKPLIERVHHGIIAVVDGLNNIIYSRGNIGYSAHMRSCAKPFQILPLMETGFFENVDMQKQYDLKPFDPVLMMSSHSGQIMHTSRVEKFLTACGLDHRALRCGIHPPYDTASFCELLRANKKPSQLHNNCSGKHVGMILACLNKGLDRHSYDNPQHPLQRRIKEIIAEVADFPVKEINMGVDGCSLPSYVLPIEKLAFMYARLSSWAHNTIKNSPPFFSRAFRIIWDRITTYPEYLAGEKRFDTDLIRAGAKRIISKGGADGILALALAPSSQFPHGLGLVIKIADGDTNQQIRSLVAKEILTALKLWPDDKYLDHHMPPTTNFRGINFGGARCHIAMLG